MLETLILATHNQGKVKEFQEMLSGVVGELKSAAEFDLPEPEETGTTFEDNALLKARAAAKATGLPCLADDSGLAVEALDGAPGIYSARWAGPEKDFTAAMQRVQDELTKASSLRKQGSSSLNEPDSCLRRNDNVEENRNAAFVATLALVMPDGAEKTFEGRAEGTLVWPPRGEKGFGYDPMFVPQGHDWTFAEMDPLEKHALSHRAKAVQKLLKFLS